MRALSLSLFLAAPLIACAARTPPPAAPEPAVAAGDADHQHADHHHHHHHGHGGAGGAAPVTHRFEHADEWVPVFDSPDRDRWQKPGELVALLAITPGMTVVDLGAGTGYFMPYLTAATGPSGKLLALDVEADMVRYLGERATREGRPNVEARQVAPDDPGLAAASVDRILIVDTWHHIGDRVAYAGRLAAALRPGGSLWVVDFTLDSDIGPPVEHRLAAADVAAELRAAGLEAEVMAAADEPLPNQYVVVAHRR